MKKYFFFLACLLLGLFNLNAQESCNGVDIIQIASITTNGVIAAEQTLTASNQITGTANVIYQAGNYVLLTGGMFVGNGASLLAKIESCMTTSVNDNFIEGFKLNLNSNPTLGILDLSFSSSNNLELEITMIDLLGRQVKTIQEMRLVPDGDHNLTTDVTDLAKGTYFLYFRTNTQKYFTEKVIKL